MSVAAQLTAAVVAELNSIEFPLAFTAARSWAPHFELKDMGTLRVTVAYGGAERERLDRTTTQDEHTVEIGVQHKLPAVTNDAIDPLVALVEAIQNALENRPLAGFPAARWLRSAIVTPAVPQHVRELRQFTGVVSVVYQTDREA